METEPTKETTNEASEAPAEAQAAAVAVPAPDSPPEDANDLGRLTPEEHQSLMQIRAQTQQLLAKVGEYDFLKARILGRVEELDAQGQQIINGVSARLGLEEGQTWVGLQDGRIRLVEQNGGGGAPPG